MGCDYSACESTSLCDLELLDIISGIHFSPFFSHVT